MIKLARVFALAIAMSIGSSISAHSGAMTGRADFEDLCAGCHNADAKGSGPVAENLTKIPPDLTRIKQRAHGVFDRKAVYDWILGLKMSQSHGTREMPIWGDWLMDDAIEGETSLDQAKAAEEEVERRVKDIVKYLETLQVED